MEKNISNESVTNNGSDQCDSESASVPQDDYDELKERYDSMNDKYLRMVAEFDNYRKRTSRERLDLVKTAGEELIQGILPVLDDFNMAQATLVDATDMQAICEGVELIYRKLYKYLESNGLQQIDAIGHFLDTDLHEAITQYPTDDSNQKGKVIDVLQKGYMLNGKVIRFAKVVVGA